MSFLKLVSLKMKLEKILISMDLAVRKIIKQNYQSF